MISCIIQKNYDFNMINTVNLTKDNIYKKCGHKNNQNFNIIRTWIWNNNKIELWGKTKGNISHINNFEFFSRENINIYGKVIYILSDKDKYISFTLEDFYKFYNEQNIFLNNKIDHNTNTNINNNTNIDNNNNNNTNIDNSNNNDNDKNNIENIINNDSELSEDTYCYSSDEN